MTMQWGCRLSCWLLLGLTAGCVMFAGGSAEPTFGAETDENPIAALAAPVWSVSQYQAWLDGLMARSADVRSAIESYHAFFAEAPLAQREAAFVAFRDYHAKVLQTLNEALLQRQKTAWRGTTDGGQQAIENLRTTIIPQQNQSAEYRDCGAEAFYEGEGDWAVKPRTGFYLQHFGPALSPATQEYLTLEARETATPWAMDAGLAISWSELGERVADWEAWLRQTPQNPWRSPAEQTFEWRWQAFIGGLDNTPVYDFATRRYDPAVLAAYRDYAERHPSTPTGLATAASLKAIEANGGLYDSNLGKELGKIIRVTITTVAARRARDYFPLRAGDRWTYRGGFENAGERVEALFAAGHRSQLTHFSTATISHFIYELRDHTIALVAFVGEDDTARNCLDLPTQRNQIILQEPIEPGQRWTSDGYESTIRSVASWAVIGETQYSDTVEVVRNAIGNGDHRIIEIYGRGIGLLSRSYEAKDGRFTQKLELIRFEPAP